MHGQFTKCSLLRCHWWQLLRPCLRLSRLRWCLGYCLPRLRLLAAKWCRWWRVVSPRQSIAAALIPRVHRSRLKRGFVSRIFWATLSLVKRWICRRFLNWRCVVMMIVKFWRFFRNTVNRLLHSADGNARSRLLPRMVERERRARENGSVSLA